MSLEVRDHALHAVTIAFVGSGALLAGLVLAGFSVLLSIWSARREDKVMVQVGRRAFYATAAMTAIASVLLELGLVTHDFQLAYVTEHTDLSMQPALVVAAFYGGQEGSLLYWALVLGVLGSASLAAAAGLGIRLSGYAAAILSSILGFFLFVLVIVASPFDVLPIAPPDGLGLNPVLRDGGMLIHPPFVLAGFSSFAIPFAFAMAALLAGRSDAAWIRQTRGVALLAWGLQSTGLILGMWWAYHVLGWGGYWGWDPVENVAFLPWIATTAYLHSSQVQERRGRLRTWNFGLVILAFLLVVFGTFIVRSGIVPSVHTFAVSSIGPWFFGFLLACTLFSAAALAFRARSLRSESVQQAIVSREGAFVLQNLLLVGIAAVILWGTVLPLISGMIGQERVVGPAYYERAAGPLFVVVLALLAVGPLLPWRRAGAPFLRALRWPASLAVVVLAGMLAFGVRDWAPLLAFPLAAAAATTSFVEYARAGVKARRMLGTLPHALARLLFAHRRRYGAYLTHLGLVVLVVGIAASHFWQQERDVTLQPGQTVTVAGYTLTYTGTTERQLADHSEQVAQMSFDGRALEPARAIYGGLGGQSLTQVAISTTPLVDVYVVLVAAGSDGSASFRVFVNPLVMWIWAGGALLILGVLLGHAGLPRRALGAAPALARDAVPAT